MNQLILQARYVVSENLLTCVAATLFIGLLLWAIF